MSTPTSDSKISTPIFRPRPVSRTILISPGHATPGWITYIATLLPPHTTANAAFQNPSNDQILIKILTALGLLKLCREFERELSADQTWTAEDEEQNDDGKFGRDNLERELEVDEVVDDLKKLGVNVEGFDRRSTWSLRAVEVNGPFEVRVDEKGHESVVEVPDRRYIYM